MRCATLAACSILVAVQLPAGAADCKNFDDILKPVLADFKGNPGQYTIDAQHLLTPIPAGAIKCLALPSKPDRLKASLHCSYFFGAEEVARAVYASFAERLMSCHPDLKRAISNKPLKEGEVDQTLAKSVSGDRGWMVKLKRADSDWEVLVMGAAVPVAQ